MADRAPVGRALASDEKSMVAMGTSYFRAYFPERVGARGRHRPQGPGLPSEPVEPPEKEKNPDKKKPGKSNNQKKMPEKIPTPRCRTPSVPSASAFRGVHWGLPSFVCVCVCVCVTGFNDFLVFIEERIGFGLKSTWVDSGGNLVAFELLARFLRPPLDRVDVIRAQRPMSARKSEPFAHWSAVFIFPMKKKQKGPRRGPSEK